MRITSIELAGTIEEGKHLPRAFARISRKLSDDYISVVINTTIITTAGAAAGNRAHEVKADDSDDQWSMAKCLQEAMDGFEGTWTDIRTYMNAIEMLAD